MVEHQLGTMELRFAELIWQSAPIASGELVRLGEAEFGWKKSTTYTMLRRLCQRGIFENNGGTVETRMSEAAFRALQSEKFVEETFGGSLPQFVAAFASRKRLSEREIAQLKQLIERSETEGR